MLCKSPGTRTDVLLAAGVSPQKPHQPRVDAAAANSPPRFAVAPNHARNARAPAPTPRTTAPRHVPSHTSQGGSRPSMLSQAGAAVDGDARAGEILFFAQEAHDACHVAGRAFAGERNLGQLAGARRPSQSSASVTVWATQVDAGAPTPPPQGVLWAAAPSSPSSCAATAVAPHLPRHRRPSRPSAAPAPAPRQSWPSVRLPVKARQRTRTRRAPPRQANRRAARASPVTAGAALARTLTDGIPPWGGRDGTCRGAVVLRVGAGAGAVRA